MNFKSQFRPDVAYFLREGISGVKIHGLMSVAAVTVIAACLLIVSTFVLIAYNLDVLIDGLGARDEIAVFVDDSLSRAEARSLELSLLAVPNVRSVSFIPREEAFERYLVELGDDAYIMESLRDDNPLRDEYRVVMEDVSLHDETVRGIKAIAGVAATNSNKEISDRLSQIKSIVNAVSYVLVAMLGAVSVFIISNTVRLAMFGRRDEISIMKMVGATNGFISAPFVVEGVVLGVSAGVIAFCAEWAVYGYITEKLVNTSGIFELLPFASFRGTLLPVMLLAGAVIGVLGSVLTIRKFLRV